MARRPQGLEGVGLPSKRELADIVVAALLIGVVPNLLLWWAASYFGVGRALFSLDYALIVALIALGYWRLGMGLLAVCLSADVLSLVSQVFPFMRVEDAAYLIRFLWIAPFEYKLWLVLALLIFFGTFFLFYIGRRRVSKACALAAVLAFFAAYLADGKGGESDQFWRVQKDRWVASQVAVFASARAVGLIANFKSSGVPLAPYEGRAATDLWRTELAQSELGERLLLVVNESWGIPLNPRIQEALLRPLRQVADLELGSVPFSGATVAGELRELCRLHPNHFAFRGAGSMLAGCLPWELQGMGYKTSAMHGATGMMYDRQDWYAEVGFPDDLFFEDVLSLPRCYSFPGACDRNLLTHLRGYFSGEGKRFFYWLTLNTHSSYDRRDLVEDLFDCPAFGVEEDTQPCRNLELQAQFFNDLATALQSPEMAGVEVIVVGDHEPRLTNQMELKNNFMPGVVPWVRLKVE